MMPLWTTATRAVACGCALRSVGAPCVAQRVWPMPVMPGSGCVSSTLARLPSLPSARRRSIWPFTSVAMPALSSLAILQFLWTWNQFLLAIVLVSDPAKRTMAGALGSFQGQWGTDIPLLCAGSLLILTPTMLLFLIFQRRFVAAMLQGSVKG